MAALLTRRELLRAVPMAAAAAAMASCRKTDPGPRFHLPEQPLEVLTSTVQAADLIREVGGEAVNVRSLILPETNTHLWQPTAADLAAIQMADVFFLSGLGLESRFTLDLEELRRRGLFAGVLANGLAEADILHRPDGQPDPHFWMDCRLWAKAAREAAAVLSAAAPPAALWFADRSHAYLTELERLHGETARQMAGLPQRSRFLLSTHDSMAYFGRACGLEVRSFGNAAGEALAKLPDALNAWITEHQLRTLFREHLADATTIRKLARPLGLNADPQIFSLSLARPATRLPGFSRELEVDFFLPAMRYTVETILGRLAVD